MNKEKQPNIQHTLQISIVRPARLMKLRSRKKMMKMLKGKNNSNYNNNNNKYKCFRNKLIGVHLEDVHRVNLNHRRSLYQKRLVLLLELHASLVVEEARKNLRNNSNQFPKATSKLQVPRIFKRHKFRNNIKSNGLLKFSSWVIHSLARI